MSAPLGKKAASGRGRRPTEHQLQMARIRARTTGESVAHVLSVFMGAGRYGAEPGDEATGPEAPPVAGTADGRGDGGGTGADRLAPVIPISRAARGRARRDGAEAAAAAEAVDTAEGAEAAEAVDTAPERRPD